MDCSPHGRVARVHAVLTQNVGDQPIHLLHQNLLNAQAPIFEPGRNPDLDQVRVVVTLA
jgi:hypothetical protein